jgi:hypothetical protein
MRARLLGIAVVAAIWPAAAAAKPAPAVHPFGYSEGGTVVTDGQRYAAYKPSAGTLVVLDDRAGRRVTVSAAGSCQLLAGAAGTFLLLCPDRNPSYVLLHAATATLGAIPGYGSSWDQFTGFAYAMGADWLQAVTSAFGDQTSFYVNWRTGARKDAAWPGQDALEPDAPPDLDSPTLRPLGPSQKVVPMAFAEGPFVLRTVAAARYGRYRPLLLYRRGRHPSVLARCHVPCGSYRLAAHRVVWAQGNAAFGYIIRQRRRIAWRLPGPVYFTGQTQHTAEHVFFSVRTGTSPSYNFNAYWARWPGR